MSKRIYSYYDETTEYPDLERAAKEMGMTVSSFQKYAVLLLVYKEESRRASKVTLQQLIANMKKALKKLSSGEVFVISSLFEPEIWTNLSASEKRTLAYVLKEIVVDNPSMYKVVARIPGKINQYKKI